MRKRTSQVVTAILGGGQGARLWPLTRDRAKPAVPVGGRFRLIDIPISNSLHAGLDRIYLLTQFNTASLHRHISQTYRFDTFSRGFVNILAAEQTVTNRDWYQGTADAVRQNITRLTDGRPSEILVLSGDQLYLMDLGSFLRFHREREASVSIAVKAVTREQAKSFGIMHVDENGRIIAFVEKPQEEEQLDELTPPKGTFERMGLKDCSDDMLLASMGIYTFTTGVLEELLDDGASTDFGREVIPRAIEQHAVYAFPYDGYWEDIGTIPAFHRANLDLVETVPPLNLYDAERPIYTHARFLPGTKIQHCDIEQAILAEGAILEGSRVRRSIIGIRAVLRKNCELENTIFMGAGSYESPEEAEGRVPIGVGENCVIRNAICDLDTRIGDGAQLINEKGVEEYDAENYAIRGGIIVVPKGATIEPGTVI
ncbi:MAG TPA: glucose-1-phosphate adenylyltransferase [Candidatus Krumholzibacteria bacterium]|nr:glucose-1-phosphate adenylyltransferase [Candidatus Krumholzibacteria bacterium]